MKPVNKFQPKQPFHEYATSFKCHWDAKQCIEAYSDCIPETVETRGVERSLRFFSTTAFSFHDAYECLSRCVPNGYNEFEVSKCLPAIAEVFGVDCKIHIAREGSVCLYVKPSCNIWIGRKSKLDSINADEISYDSDLQAFRLWWD